jgi:hypothetical protein
VITTRTKCGGCGSGDIEVFLDLGESPLADAFITQDSPPEKWFPLQLGICTACWLVQQMCVPPPADVFNSEYTFYSSASLPKVQYHQALASKILDRYDAQARKLTVEIASNDGDLLQHFKIAGCPTLGIDPAGGPTDVARGRGLDVMVDHFGLTAAKRIRSAHGEAGLIIANHVAAHVPDLDDFFGGVAYLLGTGGVAIIEAQYVGDLLVGNQFDHVYHEHRYFYSMTSLGNVAMRHGLYLQDVELTEPQGGSVQVTLGKREEPNLAVIKLFQRETWLQTREVYAGVQARVDHVRDKLVDLVDNELRAGRRVAGYGASAKSTTLLNYCELNRNKIEYVEDTTPHKIGWLTPGTHIPVVAPGDSPTPDTYLVLVHNYLSAILRRERTFVELGGRFIVPIPMPVLL